LGKYVLPDFSKIVMYEYVSVGLTSPRTVLSRPWSPDPKVEELQSLSDVRNYLLSAGM